MLALSCDHLSLLKRTVIVFGVAKLVFSIGTPNETGATTRAS